MSLLELAKMRYIRERMKYLKEDVEHYSKVTTYVLSAEEIDKLGCSK